MGELELLGSWGLHSEAVGIGERNQLSESRSTSFALSSEEKYYQQVINEKLKSAFEHQVQESQVLTLRRVVHK